ncbi:MAG: hypothetical protein A2665_01825 [Candidatus Zambryskibacteria bacterium RIFCSPHIGHO2_01_FULL_46_30]|uniref:Uncharacterized protein n=1 Tax=Candidatus Zambryskibacteria bacterium RIFCSPHIGHO2_01_FULL_46_30 TaxID=1802739 RepID=A0A1G2T403_9BACT|nr:MAG: hypothetical protein A2665_01825 [Candidatus Zambryskibacteria bacterium RIFCSPHIGHO2_01_FULL_46_30]OHB06423.1 MAG: hypothetical protein A3B22_02895 [Candidatus Zambryskibacteria bacterium RIFCSPLOWO2_01_FULL_47_33]
MRRYLAKLQKKPDHHKKQFAFLASLTITLFIFGIWSLATFGVNTRIIAEENEVSPFQSLGTNLASSLEALKGSFGVLKSGLKTVDFETKYQEMRDGALDIYGE